MPLRNTTEAYGSVAKFLHWSIVLLIVPQYFLADIADELPEGSQRAGELISLHKSIGLTVLLLAVLRLAWKLLNRPNPTPIDGVVWQRKAATVGHLVLYVMIFLQPLSGWAQASAGGHPVSLFGLVNFPAFVPEGKELHETLEELHEFFFYALLVVAGIHIVAAVYHHSVLKDATLRRMLPLSRPSA